MTTLTREMVEAAGYDIDERNRAFPSYWPSILGSFDMSNWEIIPAGTQSLGFDSPVQRIVGTNSVILPEDYYPTGHTIEEDGRLRVRPKPAPPKPPPRGKTRLERMMLGEEEDVYRRTVTVTPGGKISANPPDPHMDGSTYSGLGRKAKP